MNASPRGTIVVVGGVYREQCISPRSDEIFGSGGRAALTISTLGCPVDLHSYFAKDTYEVFSQRVVFLPQEHRVSLHATNIDQAARFRYRHWLDNPSILPPSGVIGPIRVTADHVVRFGMLEQEAVVHARRAVYDPQNAEKMRPFHENGSTADELALVLNEAQAIRLVGEGSPREMVQRLRDSKHGHVIVLKRGPFGALVADDTGLHEIPAYRSDRVWKIGSGDHFVAHFAYQWLNNNCAPKDAARYASMATSIYCGNGGQFFDEGVLEDAAKEIEISKRCRQGYRPTVYLAGPFFTLAQRWLVDEIRRQLGAMNVKVFSPIHDVGDDAGSAELAEKDLGGIDAADGVFAIADGFDPGTVFEVGYARARMKPVVLYVENEKHKHFTMFDGSGCRRCDDFVSAIYHMVWDAIAA